MKKLRRKTDSFNPMEFIDPESQTALDECRALAEALVIRTGQEKEPYWNDAAEIWIGALTGAVIALAEPPERNFQSVRALLTNPEKKQAVIDLMCASDAWQGMLSRLGGQLKNFEGKELASTLTSTNRHMRNLDTIAVSNNTKQSTFNPADLLTGKLTIYLVLPPEHMRTQSALLRLWIGSMLRACVKGGLQESKKVHFVLDEAASLGHMECLDDAIDKLRAYGVRLQLFYQSLGQLKLCWPEGRDQTVLSNTTQVYFGVNDNQTAEYISNRLGEKTIVINSGGTSSGSSYQHSRQGEGSHSTSTNTNQNWQMHGRKLLKPEEILHNLDPRTAITFSPGLPPIMTRLVKYYEPSFKKIPRRMGLFRAAFETACLFVTVATLAAWFTAAIFFYHTFD